MGWVRRVAGMGDKNNAYKIFRGQSEGKNHFEYLRIDTSIILKLTIKIG
jgi:hypothetical protein